MKSHIEFLFIFFVVILLCSCSSVTRKPDYDIYGKEAIRFHIKSDPQLNFYQGKPHTLAICVYQLRDPNAFNQLVDEKGGLLKLLGCSRFDSAVTSSKRFVIQPDGSESESLDRAEGTKYIGIVAGYFELQKDQAVRLFEIPTSIIFKKPKKVNMDLVLGPQEIQRFGRQ